jgi:membrane protease YdiL (CAAX protease family)
MQYSTINFGVQEAKSYLVVTWAVLLFVLTIIGAMPFIIEGLRFDKLSPATPFFGVAFAGMELTAFAPALAAFIVTGFFPGGGGVRALLQQLKRWRVSIKWYIVVIIGPIILFVAGDLIHIALGGAPPRQWLVFPGTSGFGPGSLFFFMGSLMLSIIGEEPGWRGFAQPCIQNRFGAFKASIVIGILWATWHLWPVITPGGLSLENPADVTATYIRMISTAIAYAWIYNSTKGSLFIVGIAHAGHNIAATLIPSPSGGINQHLIIALLYLVVAVIIVLTTQLQTLTRLKGSVVGNK